jgi:hypothetical protein
VCFFLQALSEFTCTYPGLFSSRDDGEGSDEGSSNDINKQFHRRYGWIFNTKKLADFECITLDKAWELPLIQSFNDLSYLKAKDKHDKELLDERRRKTQIQL